MPLLRNAYTNQHDAAKSACITAADLVAVLLPRPEPSSALAQTVELAALFFKLIRCTAKPGRLGQGQARAQVVNPLFGEGTKAAF